MDRTDDLERRGFVRTAGLGALGALGVAGLAAAGAPPASASTKNLMDAAAGMHGTTTTAGMLATLTINERAVACGVGVAGIETEILQGLPGIGPILDGIPILSEGFKGPFAMLMRSLSVVSYDIDRAGGEIRAKGRMQSTTILAGTTIESIKHDYIAVASDGRGMRRDEAALHFVTPFWTVGANPLATPSDEVQGWSYFGGPYMLGDVIVGH